MDQRSGSLPYMDVDELPDDIVGIDDAFLDNYLRGVEADAAVGGLLPSLNLDDAFWLDKPAQLQQHIQHRASLHLASDNSHGSQLAGLDSGPGQAQHVAFTVIGSASNNSARDPAETVAQESQLPGSGESNELQPSEAPARPTTKRNTSGSRKVTPQRKQNNRKAQQRYREKRKMQAANLEQQVVSLTAELEALQGLREAAAKHEEENAKLKAEMQAQQSELNRLRSHHAHRSGSDTLLHHDSRQSRDSSGSHPTVALEELSDDDHDAGSAGDPGKSYEATVEEMVDLKRRIQAVLKSAGLSDSETRPGQELDAQLLAKLRDLLVVAEKVSVSMLLMAPMCPMTKVLRHRAALGDAHPCSHFRSRWIKILAGLHLSAAQEDVLLNGRQELLDRLRAIYEERSQLNQITMSIMLPRRSLDQRDKDGDCGTTEGKIKSAARYGAGCMLSQTAELVTALDRLKANLSSERRMLLQLHAALVRKVLTPLQAAVMFVQADLDPVEPLHIGNLVAMNRGLVDQPPMLPPLEPHEEELLMRPYSSMVGAASNQSNAHSAVSAQS